MRNVKLIFMLLVAVLSACQTKTPELPETSAVHQPLETESGWLWTKPEVQASVDNNQISQERANKTLAADGGVCASEAGATPVQTVSCPSEFVFECVDFPEVAFTGCTSTVRGPDCRDEDLDAVFRIQEAAFVNCMLEIGWERKRADSPQ